MSIVLPLSEWEIISNKVDTCEPLNPLERFIYENLPAGEDEQLFYIQLRNALEYVKEKIVWSEMYQRGYDNAAINFAYIPDFKSEKERLDFNRGLKDGYAKIELLKSDNSAQQAKCKT